MAKSKKAPINLLPEEGLETTLAGRILSWVLSTFRIIVIVTEIIVMVAFLSRFWLDAQHTDLSEEIKQKQAVLAASAPFEKNFRDTQKRLNVFTDYSKDPGISKKMDYITDRIPADVILSSVVFNQEKVEINGLAAQESSIMQFIVNLTSDETLGEISLDKIEEEKNETNIKFTLSAFSLERQTE